MSITRVGQFAIDLFFWSLAVPLAYALRLDDDWARYAFPLSMYVLIGIPLKVLLIFHFGLHRQVWTKISANDLLTLMRAIGIESLILTALFTLAPTGAVPRSTPLMSAGLALGLLGGVRFMFRYLDERVRKTGTTNTRKVLIVGAGEAGTLMAREMLRHPEAGLHPIGFIDDNVQLRGASIASLPVYGQLNDLKQAVEQTGAHEILIAIPSASGKTIRQVVEMARQAKINHRIMPSLHEILSGKVAIAQIRPVDVTDLLRRDPIQLNMQEIDQYLEGKIVLITGAGGSIGSELTRQVARFHPKLLVLVGRGENSLYQIEQDIKRNWPEINYRSYIGDVRRISKLEQIFEETKPDVVFHAAAHKHVPFMETNHDEAIFNNVGGTLNLVHAALKHNVTRFVNISTDKAVNPTSIMGASKRVAEITGWAATQANPEQSFVSVRFGNVLESRGSVVPLFQEQIKNGGPITITHPDMTRYFMTIPEASQLVLQAAGLGENGRVYVLDMGQPIKIVDLAYDLIRLSGLEPNEDIDVLFTGMRAGEKLYEEILTAEEGTESTRHQQIYTAKQDFNKQLLENNIEDLFEAARTNNGSALRKTLKNMIPTFKILPGQLENSAGLIQPLDKHE